MSNFNICKSNTVLIIVIAATIVTEVITLRKEEVFVNESVFNISCISKEVKNIQWHHTPPGKKLNEYVYAGGRFYSPYNTGRFQEDNDLSTNVYTLVITNVKQEDAGLYECKDDVLSGVFGSTHLTVLDSSPVCTSNMNSNGFVGPNTCNIEQETMIFSCAVSFSGNSPNLTWSTLNGNEALNNSICESKDNRINCSLSMKADPSFDGSTFICQTTTSNDARHKCSIEDIRVEYFLGNYEAVEKRVGDNVTCVVESNLQIHYNWTIQQNNEDNRFSGNRIVYFQEPGFYKCSVKYSIRDVACDALIVAVNVSDIVDYTSSRLSREQSTVIAIVVSIVSVCLVAAAAIAFVIYKKCFEGKQKNQLACSYFFGFLEIVIPVFRDRFVSEIQNASAAKEPTEKTFLVKKMLIIIPKTLRSPIKLTDDTNFRSTNLVIEKRFDRAGKANRNYTIHIYELTDTKSENVYYIVADIPACLSAIRQSCDRKLIDDVNEARDDFVQTLEALLLNDPRNDFGLDFANLCELLVWPDDEKDHNRMKLSEFVCHQIESKGLAERLADIPSP